MIRVLKSNKHFFLKYFLLSIIDGCLCLNRFYDTRIFVPVVLDCRMFHSIMSTKSDAKEKDWHSSKKISKRARYILENPDEQIPSDATFLVGSDEDGPKKTFKCHKFILALVSSMFQAQFYGTFPRPEGVIGLPDITPAAFQNMLNYAYADDTAGITMENVVDTLYCANKYLISKLARACRDFAQDEIIACSNLDNIWSIFDQARLIGEDSLAAIALAEICHRTKDALEQPDFLSVSLPSLKAVLECDNLSASEPAIYQAIVRWAKERASGATDSLKVTFGPLRSCIRFTLFTPTELANGPGKDNILTDSEEKNVYRYLFADEKPDIPFTTIPRTPSSASWNCCVDLIINNGDSVGQIEILVRPDLAPVCCQYLKNMIEGGYRLYFCNKVNEEPNEVLPLPALVAQEHTCLAHSTRDAVWFEWNEPFVRLHLCAWGKPGRRYSAVFGHVCSAFGEDGFDRFRKLCRESAVKGHVEFSL